MNKWELKFQTTIDKLVYWLEDISYDNSFRLFIAFVIVMGKVHEILFKQRYLWKSKEQPTGPPTKFNMKEVAEAMECLSNAGVEEKVMYGHDPDNPTGFVEIAKEDESGLSVRVRKFNDEKDTDEVKKLKLEIVAEAMAQEEDRVMGITGDSRFDRDKYIKDQLDKERNK